ncbi:FIST C domain protein [Tepidimonas thermarum]|uniref:FIST C domain protein n=1 Tax=Tepidimonas thermarum TaxID=335431 RepID=A0A554X3L3_9BURK|nr:FIST N-terminal domain-containing protein [Tepidimonas thermarum]TSE30434.1 FIST C domain protein [Tepidimonas thermarum]
MKRFVHAHATHPQWPMAAALVLAQLRAQLAVGAADGQAAQAEAASRLGAGAATTPLGLVYLTDDYADAAADILDHLSHALPQVTDWVGAIGVGICATGAEYIDEPGLAVMLCDLAPSRYRVFSGLVPLGATQGPEGFVPQTALVHADPATPELTELVQELAERTIGHYLFGGLVASRAGSVQIARSSRGAVVGHGREAAHGIYPGGFSGVAFGPDVGIVSRVTQGVRAVSPVYRITAAQGNRVEALDGQPALEVLLRDLGLSLDDLGAVVARLRETLVGLQVPQAQAAIAPARPGRVPLRVGDDVLVRHVIGLDPLRRAVVIADEAPLGGTWMLCERHAQAARADLVRICAEIRDELSPDAGDGLAHDPVARIAGAVYVSCNRRGGPHFGAAGAELQIVRQALGDVPLVGFFAAGEIAHHRLYGYTGVLTVFVADEGAGPDG